MSTVYSVSIMHYDGVRDKVMVIEDKPNLFNNMSKKKVEHLLENPDISTTQLNQMHRMLGQKNMFWCSVIGQQQALLDRDWDVTALKRSSSSEAGSYSLHRCQEQSALSEPMGSRALVIPRTYCVLEYSQSLTALLDRDWDVTALKKSSSSEAGSYSLHRCQEQSALSEPMESRALVIPRTNCVLEYSQSLTALLDRDWDVTALKRSSSSEAGSYLLHRCQEQSALSEPMGSRALVIPRTNCVLEYSQSLTDNAGSKAEPGITDNKDEAVSSETGAHFLHETLKFSGENYHFHSNNHMDVTVVLIIEIFTCLPVTLRNVPCIPTLSKAFIMKGCWILSKAFSASNEMIMCCYVSNFISDFINLDALSLHFAFFSEVVSIFEVECFKYYVNPHSVLPSFHSNSSILTVPPHV
ncbi:hypothetical protein STEG23_005684 [Scotinomys teguina]